MDSRPYFVSGRRLVASVMLLMAAFVGAQGSSYSYANSFGGQFFQVRMYSKGAMVTQKHTYAAAIRGYRLALYSLDTMTSPKELSSLFLGTESYTFDIAAFGSSLLNPNHYAVMGCSDNTLLIVDINNAAAPKIVGTYKTKNYITRVSASGSSVQVFTRGFGLEIVDISDPSHPKQKAKYAISSDYASIQGKYLYAFKYYDSLCIYDTTGGTLVKKGATTVSEGSYKCKECIVSDKVLYACFDYKAYVIDISNPAAPVQTDFIYINACSGMSVSGKFLYLLQQGKTFAIYDITQPAHPVQDGTYLVSTMDYGNAFDIGYNHAVIMCWKSMAVLNLQQSYPQLVAKVPTYGEINGMAVSGDTVIVADKTLGASGFIVSPDGVARHFKDYVLNEGILQVAVENGVLYAMKDSTLRLFSVANGNLLGLVSIQPAAYRLAVGNKKACIAGSYGYEIINCSNPAQLQTASKVSRKIAKGCYRAAANDSIAVFTSSDDTLRVCRIGGPGPLVAQQVGTLIISAQDDPTIKGTVVYLGVLSKVCAISLANPASPVVIGQIANQMSSNSNRSNLRVRGDTLLVSDHSGSLDIIDCGSPAAMKETGSLNMFSSPPTDIAFSEFLYVSSYFGGVLIVRWPNQTSVAMHGNLPAFDDGARFPRCVFNARLSRFPGTGGRMPFFTLQGRRIVPAQQTGSGAGAVFTSPGAFVTRPDNSRGKASAAIATKR